PGRLLGGIRDRVLSSIRDRGGRIACDWPDVLTHPGCLLSGIRDRIPPSNRDSCPRLLQGDSRTNKQTSGYNAGASDTSATVNPNSFSICEMVFEKREELEK